MTSLEVRRSLPHPADRVWRAFTDPAALAAWFWPQRFDPVVSVDLRVGGSYRIDGPGAGMAVSGVYREVTPPSRLVFTWQWDNETETTLVTVTIVPSATGTELMIRHERFEDDVVRDAHEQGWSDCLDRLPEWLARDPHPACTRSCHERQLTRSTVDG
ncbi:SRPBCC domain-containing protein [Lentzea tibetensis]|uniref:SRPBCC domain-containing protein n=1 Tax=Lentzea tibetensis TaxID=2591470 RepID=A0A563F3E6_9PSEU|nr:SRPBCC domain-containing protein [Lentzea tibetensis]TWP54362.1 SRPBCC domain-containing protein [Lentzea tibetensis]